MQVAAACRLQELGLLWGPLTLSRVFPVLLGVKMRPFRLVIGIEAGIGASVVATEQQDLLVEEKMARRQGGGFTVK